jgi:hypothetical protein
VKLTLLTRAYCHLCDEMLAAVRPLAAARGAIVAVVDVDTDPALERAFGELVPLSSPAIRGRRRAVPLPPLTARVETGCPDPEASDRGRVRGQIPLKFNMIRAVGGTIRCPFVLAWP